MEPRTRRSRNKQHHLKAIIYDKRGRILSIGENSYTKTHPMMAQLAEQAGEPHKTFLHAEVSAIIRCSDLAKAHKIKIFRFSQEGKPVMAKPCRICMSAIAATNIKEIEHT